MPTIDKTLYTARVHTTGGREGAARADDGRLDVRLASPGSHAAGTNPEQLLAAGWSSCFLSAIQHAGRELKVTVPRDLAIDAEVDLGTNAAGWQLSARLNVSLPGVERTVAERLVAIAHDTCQYSKALRGSIPVETIIR